MTMNAASLVLRRYLMTACLVVAVPAATWAACGGGGTSSLPSPGVTYLRSYRAPFRVPTRMAVDAWGNVYVTDPGQGQVVVRAPNGRVISRANGLGRPVSVAVGNGGKVYVGDAESGSVTAFDTDWKPVLQLGQGRGEFLQPSDVAVDGVTGNLYVADGKAHLVKVYSAAGAFQSSFGGHGSGDGLFNFPVGVMVDAAARQVLVVDQLNYRVQVFDLSGTFQSCFGSQGSGPGKFNMPQGVAIDSRGRVYVADSVEGRIQVLDRAGGFVGYIGDFGDAAGQLRIPIGMVIDPSNRLFVAAANNARLEVFGLDTFADPETVVPAAFRTESDPIDRAAPGADVVGYVEVPGYSLDHIVSNSIVANGIPAATTLPVVGDHDGNGIPELRVQFDRQALLATLPVLGTGTVALSGLLGAKRFEGSAVVHVTTCGPETTCPLGDADPRCTEAICDAAVGCTLRPKLDGAGCEDGNACTVDDACRSGACVGTVLRCDDGEVCTDDTCDPIGGCVHASNTVPCDDGDACTAGDVCGGGVCSGVSLRCDDDNRCTDDTCDPAKGCVHASNTLPCDDRNPCTGPDTCAGGTCGGALLGCDDGNGCTDDACNPARGCVHTNNAASCNDGNACTGPDSCAGGMCSGAPRRCDDGNGCTDDACNPARGCVHTGNTLPCDDADRGTMRDACDGAGSCHGTGTTGDYALLCWPLESDGHKLLSLGGRAVIRGNICAENMLVGPLSLIEGDAVAWASDGWAAAFRPGSLIVGDVATGGGRVQGLDLVTTDGRVEIGGASAALEACVAARHRATSRRADFAALPSTPGFALGAIEVGRGASRRIPSLGDLGTGRTVIDAANLRLDASSTLTLVGTAATEAVIVHVRGPMLLGRAARIVFDAVPAERVIFVVDGSVILHAEASVTGSVFAAGRVQMGSASTVAGALLGSAIDLAPSAAVELHPFVGW